MIRHMQPNDITRVTEIHVYGGRVGYRGIISDERLFNERTFENRKPRFEQIQDGAKIYVYDDGIVKGYTTIGTSRDQDRPNAFEIWNIYTDPCFHREGIGTKLMEFCESQSTALGYTEIILWVFEQNHVARAFYEKLGFHPDSTTRTNKAPSLRYTKLTNRPNT